MWGAHTPISVWYFTTQKMCVLQALLNHIMTQTSKRSLAHCFRQHLSNSKAQKMQSEKNQSTTMENGEKREERQTPLMALNHISRVCRSVKDWVDFYTKVVGFVLIERPDAFDFDGAWLFNYGIGIHLVHDEDEGKLPRDKEHLDPMDNHISFQCESMEAMEQKLKENNIRYMKRTVGDEEEAAIDQLFFNNPDGFMIEICNCENLKLVPEDSLGSIKLPFDRHTPPVKSDKKSGN